MSCPASVLRVFVALSDALTGLIRAADAPVSPRARHSVTPVVPGRLALFDSLVAVVSAAGAAEDAVARALVEAGCAGGLDRSPSLLVAGRIRVGAADALARGSFSEEDMIVWTNSVSKLLLSLTAPKF